MGKADSSKKGGLCARYGVRYRIRKQIHYNTRTNMKKVDEVYKQFEMGRDHFGSIRKLSEKCNIPKSTVDRWYNTYQLDPDWRPYFNENHGLHNRIFTDEQEKAIADYIRENYIQQGILFTDQDFVNLAMQAFLTIHRNNEHPPEFNVSAGFIYAFKKRNRISSLLAHPKRRSESDPQLNENWEKTIKQLLKDVPRDHILNCDETAWQVFPNNVRTWAETGSQNVQIHVHGNTKDSVTALATIAADGTKCPLYLIAKGKTIRCEKSQLGDTVYHFTNHSSNGWSTFATFKEYLHQISDHFHKEPLHLILDLHASHRGDEIQKLANSLNITLHYIPAGQTDKYQPLDRICFGCLKATGRSQFRIQASENPDAKFDKKAAIQSLIYAWEHLSPVTILQSWDIYIDE